ncbi:DUF6082 family protein [Streptomyces griseus]|uniref:DUF6082 family protein n=1 Tax=Streptomyces griseus TaxID=1911 RepID=UPI00378EFD07
MKINPYALAGLALGVAAIGLAERHHRVNKELFFTELHNKMLGEVGADPRLSVSIKSSHFEGMDADGIAAMTAANRWLGLWTRMLKHGFLSKTTMRRVAETFMQGETNREFWERAEPTRRTMFDDRNDEVFHGLMHDAYTDALAP